MTIFRFTRGRCMIWDVTVVHTFCNSINAIDSSRNHTPLTWQRLLTTPSIYQVIHASMIDDYAFEPLGFALGVFESNSKRFIVDIRNRIRR